MPKKTVTIRYKLLPKFPQDIIEVVNKAFHEKFPDIKSWEDIPLSNHENSILRYKGIEAEIPHDLFANKILCMISFPNCGRGQIHIDQGRDFSINIPIQVDYDKGPFVTIKDGLYGNVVETGHINYDYIEEYYEDVKVDCPILVNTAIPHAFVNDSDKWRIMLSIFPKADNIEEAWELVSQWS